MPELPEVEVIKEGLKKKVKHRKITGVEVRFSKLIKNVSPSLFRKRVIGKEVKEISRRGKFLIFSLDDSSFLVIHLKMTGQLIYCSPDEEVDKHTGIIFTLDNNFQLRFLDMRRFGIVCLAKKLEEITTLANLGPEPLENNFTSLVLKKILENQKRKIKIVLIDQKIMAGLGNIYAVEALYQAKINPEKRAYQLTEPEIKTLYRAIKAILKKAISARGTSTDAYRDSEGRKGRFQYQLQVYGRQGESCYRCGTKVSRIKISGRGTYFCPGCQK